MSLKQLLFLGEGILNIKPRDVPDELYDLANNYERMANRLVRDIKNSQFIVTHHKQYREELVKILNDVKEGNVARKDVSDRVINIIDTYYKELYPIMEDIVKDYKLNMEFMIDPVSQSSLHNALFAIRPFGTYIELQFNLISFIDNIFTNEKRVADLLASTIEHELVHASQHKKYDIKAIKDKIRGRKNISGMDDYMITPLEVPAQAKSLASIYYRYNNKDINKSAQMLKRLDIPEDIDPQDKLQLDTIRNNKNNKKFKKIIKYAHLYLEKLKQEE
jgi:hypothetical protein